MLAQTAEIDRLPHSGLDSTVPQQLGIGSKTPGFITSIASEVYVQLPERMAFVVATTRTLDHAPEPVKKL